MLLATLLCAPGAGVLNRDVVQALADRWGGSAPRWLADNEAAEFDLTTMPGDRWDRWEALQRDGIDLNIQVQASERRKRMLIADMDSTMIGQECIDELAEVAGVGAHVKDITARAMNGELDFDGALTERVALLKDLPETVIGDVYRDRITMASGARVLLATMRAAGAHTVLVSGGFTAFSTMVASDLGFDAHRANVLLSADGRLTGKVRLPILGRDAKVETLEETVTRLGITTRDVVAVGDGANDLGMLGRAGMGVALHAKPAVAAQCDLRVNYGDLTALLYLQGFTRAEFAEI